MNIDIYCAELCKLSYLNKRNNCLFIENKKQIVNVILIILI